MKTKISKNNQTSVPIKILEAIDAKSGDQLLWELKKGKAGTISIEVRKSLSAYEILKSTKLKDKNFYSRSYGSVKNYIKQLREE